MNFRLLNVIFFECTFCSLSYFVVIVSLIMVLYCRYFGLKLSEDYYFLYCENRRCLLLASSLISGFYHFLVPYCVCFHF